MAKPVIIFGANGIGKAALEIFRSSGIDVLGFLDDDENLFGKEVNNIPVLGKTGNEEYLKLLKEKSESFVALDETILRKKQIETLVNEYKSMPINAIHSSAIIPDSVHIGHGNFINAGVIIGSYAKVPNHCLLHSGTIIEHEAQLGNFTQIGAGSIINPGVIIEEGVFIGSGVTIVSGIIVRKNAKIGAGSVVVSNVEKSQVMFGNPAKQVSA
ncbi:MAG TPA: acetyltransferase [Cyclobacteriaceae bacterium]|jgi:sugar O-acyltransferase (sialic acid O-acetyltransferase NeuD family)